MTKKKGDKHHTEIEKNIVISLIQDYRLFNCSDREMLRLINQKTGATISWTTFRTLKAQATKKDTVASEWLDIYCKNQIVDHYWKRIKELEYVQRILLDEITQEYSKTDHKNKYVIVQLARTIGETATKLQEMGMSPPVLAKLYSMIPKEILQDTISNDPIELEKYLKLFHDNLEQDKKDNNRKEKAIPKLVDSNIVSEKNESNSRTTTTTTTSESDKNDRNDNEIDPLSAETAIPPPIDKKNDTRPDGDTQGETATAQGDQPIF